MNPIRLGDSDGVQNGHACLSKHECQFEIYFTMTSDHGANFLGVTSLCAFSGKHIRARRHSRFVVEAWSFKCILRAVNAF